MAAMPPSVASAPGSTEKNTPSGRSFSSSGAASPRPGRSRPCPRPRAAGCGSSASCRRHAALSAATWPSRPSRAERHDRRSVRAADPHDRGRLLGVARVDDDVGRGGGCQPSSVPCRRRSSSPVTTRSASSAAISSSCRPIAVTIRAMAPSAAPASCCYRRAARARGAARASRRAVLGQEGPRRVVDPEGRARRGRGRARVRAARVRGGDRQHARTRASSTTSAACVRNRARSCRRGRSRATSTRARSARTRSRWSGRRGPAAGASSPRSTAPSGSPSLRRVERINPAQAAFLDRLRDRFDS